MSGWLVTELGFLLLQGILLALLVFLSQRGTARHFMFHRNFGPAMWFSAFYLFWFLIPQAIALFGDHYIVGFGELPSEDRLRVLQAVQLNLTLFLALVVMGFAPISFLKPSIECAVPPIPLRPDPHWLFGASSIVIGLAAFAYLGTMQQEGMRSELVKTLTGKAAYALTFFGSFGVAYLCSHLFLRGRTFPALVLAACYAAIALQIGARGRVLWPLVFIMVFLWACSGRRLPYLIIILLVSILLGMLSLLDPIYLAIQRGDLRSLLNLDFFEVYLRVFYGRNFDGLGNFSTICYYDRIAAKPEVLLTGARDLYMKTYYPAIIALGVGFPPTVPGELWIAGGRTMLAAGAVVYGAAIGVIDLILRRARDEETFWAYLVLIPWIAAVGGALFESLAKILAAMIPVLLLIFMRFLSASFGRLRVHAV